MGLTYIPANPVALSVIALLVSMMVACTDSSSTHPHIVLFLADDLGHACVGRNTAVPQEIQTPNIDAIFGDDGVTLTRHYTYKFCAPTRSALQSGRLPVHVNTVNAEPECRNPDDPVSGYAGIPRNMTTIATLLARQGYTTIMSGKWDAGMATPRHIPSGRGYEQFLGYFHHANDYYTAGLPYAAIGTVNVCKNKYTDLWKHGRPAYGINGTGYEPEIFANHSKDAITLHARSSRANRHAEADTATINSTSSIDHAAAHASPAPVSTPSTPPLFLFHAFHLIHTPLEVPQAWLDKFKHIDNDQRHKVAAMVSYMDNVVGEIVTTLKNEAMWNNTLCVFFADNGGALYYPAGGNNYPLRGGKYSDFEGGTNTVAFVSGGVLPPSSRGTTYDALVSAADWYGTFADAASVVGWEHDEEAEAAGLPPVDSVSHWPSIIGRSTSQRKGGRRRGQHLNATYSGGGGSGGNGGSSSGTVRASIHLSSQAFVHGSYKVVTGMQVMAIYQGPSYPNNSGTQPLDKPVQGGRFDCGVGCLFDVLRDPTEHHDLAAEQPEQLATMLELLAEANKTLFAPDRGAGDPQACVQARKYGGYYGPWLQL